MPDVPNGDKRVLYNSLIDMEEQIYTKDPCLERGLSTFPPGRQAATQYVLVKHTVNKPKKHSVNKPNPYFNIKKSKLILPHLYSDL